MIHAGCDQNGKPVPGAPCLDACRRQDIITLSMTDLSHEANDEIDRVMAEIEALAGGLCGPEPQA
jgi:hypothetical protein